MARPRKPPKITGWKPNEFLRFLRKNGCGIEEGVGRHKIAVHPEDSSITEQFPYGGNKKEVPPYVVNKVLKAMGLK